MQLALSLVLCSNIGLLIYGIHESTYIVGRISVVSQQVQNRSATYRRRKAKCLILGVWALPTLFGLLAMTPWNCTVAQCTCTLSLQSGNSICTGKRCSQLYTPMAKSYLFVVVLLWGLECLGLLILMTKSVYSLIRSEKKSFQSMSRSEIFVKVVNTNKIIFVLFVLFVCCTGPVMMLFALDFSIPGITFNHDIVNFMIPLPLFYCFLSPILLMVRLSGVRSALLSVLSFPCEKRCKTKKKSQRKSTSSSGPRPTSISLSDYPKSTLM